MAISKIIYGGQTLIDLTSDTVVADKLKKGYTAHGPNGELIEGTCEHDANTQDATATEAEILAGKTAYNKGNKITGAMPNNGAVSGIISNVSDVYKVPQGYHDGSGQVSISTTEMAKLIPTNIRAGITVLGVAGMMTGSEDLKAQSKEVVPTAAQQEVLPDVGYNALAAVIVKPIPYIESTNSAGGVTVTIG